ncbi:C40 family peptidase [Fundidesulfovibrio butyratiphilus]
MRRKGERNTSGLLLAVLALVVLAGCAGEIPGPQRRQVYKESVLETARQQIGVPYRSGGESPREGFDCSGLVQWTYARHGVKLPRRTEDQLKAGRPVSKSDLIPGDLVFFNVSRKRWGLHVGIYSGKGRFIHSPTPGSRVREESLDIRYWVRTYIGARRVDSLSR